MSVLDVLNAPWAITPEKFDSIVTVYDRHLAMSKLDAEAVKVAIGGNPSANGQSQSPYDVQDGVAVIPVDGVLAKKMNIFTAISGGMSTEMLIDAVNEANADASVHSIILAMDSPGGTVDGTQQFGDAVKASQKPIVTWVDGQCCSAAYWVAAQSDTIWAASQADEIGSIGVVVKHIDQSKANEQAGLSVTHITAGKYKRIANGDEPLSQDGRAHLQDKVDYLCTLFVNAVADGRGESPDTVWADMGEGQTFFAQQAIDAGLIDGMATQDQVIAMLNADNQKRISQPGASALRKSKPGATTMPFKAFETEADFNAFVESTSTAAKATVDTSAAVAAARTEGATAERERCAAIEAVPLAAQYPAIVTALKADGKSGKAEAMEAILTAEAKSRTTNADARKEDIPKPVDASVVDPKDDKKAGAEATAKPVPTVAEIRDQMAKAKAQGRTISSAEAAALVDASRT